MFTCGPHLPASPYFIHIHPYFIPVPKAARRLKLWDGSALPGAWWEDCPVLNCVRPPEVGQRREVQRKRDKDRGGTGLGRGAESSFLKWS